jgi:hypothetical protein
MQPAIPVIPVFAGFAEEQVHHKHHTASHIAMKTEFVTQLLTRTNQPFATITASSWIEALRTARQYRKQHTQRELHVKTTSALPRR